MYPSAAQIHASEAHLRNSGWCSISKCTMEVFLITRNGWHCEFICLDLLFVTILLCRTVNDAI